MLLTPQPITLRAIDELACSGMGPFKAYLGILSCGGLDDLQWKMPDVAGNGREMRYSYSLH